MTSFKLGPKAAFAHTERDGADAAASASSRPRSSDWARVCADVFLAEIAAPAMSPEPPDCTARALVQQRHHPGPRLSPVIARPPLLLPLRGQIQVRPRTRCLSGRGGWESGRPDALTPAPGTEETTQCPRWHPRHHRQGRVPLHVVCVRPARVTAGHPFRPEPPARTRAPSLFGRHPAGVRGLLPLLPLGPGTVRPSPPVPSDPPPPAATCVCTVLSSWALTLHVVRLSLPALKEPSSLNITKDPPTRPSPPTTPLGTPVTPQALALLPHLPHVPASTPLSLTHTAGRQWVGIQPLCHFLL
ncbi:uncharacterized protein LOC131484283 [Neofelis nebulosa]|uniref:uncharacterized protein LOC131484283 n=1 Tax=Neofelis nebulosa TaxID=61452 RepID=UPI00272B5D89|nr:uncharacterized protein LOC131484283 [Neofelis nebulosa]